MSGNDHRPLEILGLVDLHWSAKRPLELPDLEGVDLVLLAGDLTHFRGSAVAESLLRSVTDAGPRVLAICGNVDRPEIESLLDRQGIALDRQARIVDGVRFVGLSGGLPFGGCPYERSEEAFAKAADTAWAAAEALPAAELTVFLSHQPPRDTACDLSRGRHVGSRAIRDCIEKRQPDLVLCGHIHEAIGCDWIGNSLIVNPGPWLAGNLLRFRIDRGKIELRPPLPPGAETAQSES